MSSTLRSGRLASTRKDVVKFISSVDQDSRITHSVLLVNKAHVKALAKASVIKPQDAQRLLGALDKLEKISLSQTNVEDVHVLIEDQVTKTVGATVGGMLNAGKSRNDQVATAIRMTLREHLLELSKLILELEKRLLRLAKSHKTSLFVGFTHQQPAQPITFAHYLIAIGDSLMRDNQRVMEAHSRANLCPMGSAALAGTSFPIDRTYVANLMGFDGLIENSLDAVSSRDFVMDTLHACSTVAADLSRFAQDLIFYSSTGLSLIDLPDQFSSTSSIMPQKKNPDALEIVRARCAMVTGNYCSASNLIHGLTTGYNLDYQELTPLIWDSLDNISSCLSIVNELVLDVKLGESLTNNYSIQFTVAAELANVLVQSEGIPFRQAHHILGRAIATIIEKRQNLQDLDEESWETLLGRPLGRTTFRKFRDAVSLTRQASSYKTVGSPGRTSVQKMMSSRRREAERMGRETARLASQARISSKSLSRTRV